MALEIVKSWLAAFKAPHAQVFPDTLSGSALFTAGIVQTKTGLVDGEIHDLALLCFLEELDPESLPLSPQVAQLVVRDIERLHERPALEAYLFCLEKLQGEL